MYVDTYDHLQSCVPSEILTGIADYPEDSQDAPLRDAIFGRRHTKFARGSFTSARVLESSCSFATELE